MNNVTIFNNPEFGKIRVAGTSNEPLFCGSDLAVILGFRDSFTALRCVDSDDTQIVCSVDSIGKRQEIKFVNESGLYQLILKSNKPEAKQFRKWVTSEILPSIRKTGGYITSQPDDTDEEIMARALMVAQNTINRKNGRIKQLEVETLRMKPKEEFYDAVIESDSTIDIGGVAKVLNMGVGRNKLFEILRDAKVLMSNNAPYQTYVDRGWFRCIEVRFDDGAGKTRVGIKTTTFQKGVDGIRKLLLNKLSNNK